MSFPVLRYHGAIEVFGPWYLTLDFSTPGVFLVLWLFYPICDFFHSGVRRARVGRVPAQLTCLGIPFPATNPDNVFWVVLGPHQASKGPAQLTAVDLVQPTKTFYAPREELVDLAACGRVGSFHGREEIVELTGLQKGVELCEGSVPVFPRNNHELCEFPERPRAMELQPELPPALPDVVFEFVARAEVL